MKRRARWSSGEFRKCRWRRMIRMRIEAAFKDPRLVIINAARQKRVLAGNKGKDEARVPRSTTIIDARQHAADFVGIEQGPLMNRIPSNRQSMSSDRLRDREKDQPFE